MLVGAQCAVAPADVTGQHAPAPSALSRDWKRVRSEHFVAVGNTSDGALRTALVELERFQQSLLALFPSVALEPVVPKMLVLFRNDSSLMPFKPRDDRGRIQRSVAGYFTMHPDVMYMVAGVTADRSTTYTIIFHEYAHYLIHRARQPVPRWVDEGLAEFYSTFRMHRDGRGIIGEIPRWRLSTLRSGEPLLTFGQLFTSEGAARALRNDVYRQRFYAHAWLLAHYSMVGDRAGQLAAYVRALDSGLSVEDAFQDAYGVSFEALQRELRSYLRRPMLPALAVTFPLQDVVVSPVEPMPETDALQLQGDLVMRLGADADAERLLTSALSLDPDHVAARVSLAGVHRHHDRRSEAIGMLHGVISDAPRDFAGHYWLGVDLAHERRYDEAINALSRAVEINTRSADAWLELSVAARALGRTAQSNAAFEQARMLHPGPSWYQRRGPRLFHIGDDAGVAADVASYVREAGWANERSPYMAFLGALALWRLGDHAAADALVAQAAAAVDESSWAAVVAGFLRGSLTRQAFLGRARGAGEQTEAQAYIGLKASVLGSRNDALPHLQWVRDRGRRDQTEYGLAVAELRRLESSPAPAPAGPQPGVPQ